MNIQTVLTDLKNLGYHLSLEGSTLRYKCLSLIEPPKDKVLPLLDTLKRNRQAVIDYLKPKNKAIPYDSLKSLYLEAFNRTGWIIGLMDRPEVIQAEDKLNEVWLACMEGKATLEDFKATLNKWETVVKGGYVMIKGQREAE